MRKETPTIASLSRSHATLEAMIADGGERSVTAIARELGIPVATAHRQVASLAAEGYLARLSDGRHIAGPALLRLARRIDERQLIARVAAPVLVELADRLGSVAQLGTLDNDMVTYRIKVGLGAGALFTRVGLQLEAYCSGIGKTLLAHLGTRDLAAYLATGPFVALTDRTIVDPDALAGALDAVRSAGHARDDGEMVAGLYCLAAPIRAADGGVPAAISVSSADDGASQPQRLDAVLAAAAQISERIGAHGLGLGLGHAGRQAN
jgi:IclR family acetate operon transcriptional repressor